MFHLIHRNYAQLQSSFLAVIEGHVHSWPFEGFEVYMVEDEEAFLPSHYYYWLIGILYIVVNREHNKTL